MAIMTRATALRIAAALSVLVAVIGITLFDLPNLVLGAAGSKAPFALVLAGLMLVHHLVVITLCLWRERVVSAV